jgi:hypothetical protein
MSCFVRESHVTLAPKVGDLFDAYNVWVGEDALDFVVSSEEWKPLTPKRLMNAWPMPPFDCST